MYFSRIYIRVRCDYNFAHAICICITRTGIGEHVCSQLKNDVRSNSQQYHTCISQITWLPLTFSLRGVFEQYFSLWNTLCPLTKPYYRYERLYVWVTTLVAYGRFVTEPWRQIVGLSPRDLTIMMTSHYCCYCGFWARKSMAFLRVQFN